MRKRPAPPPRCSIEPLCGAFVFLDAGAYSMVTTRKIAYAPRVATTLLRDIKNVVFAHPLVGPADLLIGVTNKTPTTLLEILDTLKQTRVKNRAMYFHSTDCHLIRGCYGRDPKTLDRASFPIDDSRPQFPAWILAALAQPKQPPEIVAQTLLNKSQSIQLVVPVVGKFDYFIYVTAPTIQELQTVVDDDIRSGATGVSFIATDTRIVMQE